MGNNLAVKIILGLLLINILILTGIERVAFNDEFYIKSFEKYNIPEDTGMEMDELILMKTNLISYLQGKEDYLSPLYFTERDRLHMIDVKDLFFKGYKVRNWSLAILPIILLFIYICEGIKGIIKTLKWSAGIPLLIIIGFTLLALTDFNRYFTYFHLIFFDNDLWILDPAKDMVKYFPEDFFLTSAIYAVVFCAIWLISIVVFSLIAEKYYIKHKILK